MKTVRIETNELYRIVENNRDKHIKEHIEAVEDYIELVLAITASNFELAETEDLKRIAQIRSIPSAPVSYESDYNRALRMLDLSVDDVTELSQQEFDQLVLDEWAWKHSFTAMKTIYKKG